MTTSFILPIVRQKQTNNRTRSLCISLTEVPDDRYRNDNFYENGNRVSECLNERLSKTTSISVNELTIFRPPNPPDSTSTATGYA